jgi:anaerobic magnesium-protoporphyrin IX monomethyl ester cyclase
MTSILLIYPFFKPRFDRSVFRFPPLGISYMAAALRRAGHDVSLLDCTFTKRKVAMEKALETNARIVGLYCMATMIEDCFLFADLLRNRTGLLVAGGPMPTASPDLFLDRFDVVVRGEGEQTMAELLQTWEKGLDLESVRGIAFARKADAASGTGGNVVTTAPRPFSGDLDHIAFPARDLLPNESYLSHGKRAYGFSITTIMTTRGCPFQCDFCSNVIFGGSYRERSTENVVDEIEEALGLGYERISFADDVFTMNPGRVRAICREIETRGLHFQWECLGRVDTMDYPLAAAMKKAGCTRIFFGIESGNDEILGLMNKKITVNQARGAVEAAHRAGLHVGAFFIVGYPGDTNDSALQTIRFALSMPLDYLGLAMPQPLPETGLYKRLFEHPGNEPAGFSKTKIRFGIAKGKAHFIAQKKLGSLGRPALRLFELITDALFRLLK